MLRPDLQSCEIELAKHTVSRDRGDMEHGARAWCSPNTLVRAPVRHSQGVPRVPGAAVLAVTVVPIAGAAE